MAWVVYENSDELTQVFVGVFLLLVLTTMFGLAAIFWIKEKIKKK